MGDNKIIIALGLGLVLGLGWGCSSKKGEKEESSQTAGTPAATTPSPTPAARANAEARSEPQDGGDQDSATAGQGEGDGYPVRGIIARRFGLEQQADATHVVARNTATGETRSAEIDGESGEFAVELDRDQPWVISWVNADAEGADMLVGRFGCGSLDTVAPAADAEAMDMGDVDPAGSGAAATDLGEEQCRDAMGISDEAAETFGELDDASLNSLNPDVDGNGILDTEENKQFALEFHNRFYARDEAGNGLTMEDLKNAFPPADARYSHSGTGIIPAFSDNALPGAGHGPYQWTFAADVQSSSCDTPGDVMAGTACRISPDANSYTEQNLGIEVSTPPVGQYRLQAGDYTLTWTGVRVSDFSAGKGFLALFTRFDVSDAGQLTGVSYQWMKKGSDGIYTQATSEEIHLIVKKDSPRISLKVDGMNSGKSLGAAIPRTPAGSVSLDPDSPSLILQGLDAADLDAGIAWERVLENPGISYDDKLGMRFFFSVY